MFMFDCTHVNMFETFKRSHLKLFRGFNDGHPHAQIEDNICGKDANYNRRKHGENGRACWFPHVAVAPEYHNTATLTDWHLFPENAFTEPVRLIQRTMQQEKLKLGMFTELTISGWLQC